MSCSSEKVKFITFCELSPIIKFHSSLKMAIKLTYVPHTKEMIFVQKFIHTSLIINF